MDAVRVLTQPLSWLAERVFALWARPTIAPAVPAELVPDSGLPVCYVLETGGLADTLALERLARRHGLVSPTSPLEFAGISEPNRIVVLRQKRGLIVQRPSLESPGRLKRLVEASIGSGGEELLLVPVAVYWGRAPDKETSVWKLLFSEDWEIAGRTRKFFVTLFQGRNTLVSISKPLLLGSITRSEPEPELAYRKVWRILRVHFRRRRIATVGPDLSNRSTIVNAVMRNPSVQRVINDEAGGDPDERIRQEHKARGYTREIAAHISYATVRALDRLLGWLLNRIYDGIELQHAGRLQRAAEGREIVYVPCHRSHFDYILLSYIVYHQGLSLPHVAAGINLDLPFVGPILRRGGAFFLRRSFRGNRLYAAVFSAYLHELLTRGHPIEYFVEGGRSRTGRLLSPKAGLLAMTVSSYLREPRRPIVFVPIYFGYEKLIEGDSFISELGGAEKRKESLLGLARSVRGLRKRFGKVFVNVGKPIELAALLDERRPDWRETAVSDAERPPWITEVIDDLGNRIMAEINASAAVTPISLLALVLLSTPKQTMGMAELKRQLQLSLSLLRRFRYSDSVTLPELSAEEICEHGVDMGVIQITPHELGDVVHMSQRNAVLMTYFRNNILHLVAVPAAVACCFLHGRQLEHAELVRLVKLIYPFMKKELRLQWSARDIESVTAGSISALVDLELLARGRNTRILARPPSGSARAYQLLVLGQLMVPMLQRFYLVIAQLIRNGSGTLSRAALEHLCEKSAERLSMIYGLHSPDFFNRGLFQDFIAELRRRDVLRRNSDGKLEFDEAIAGIGEDARLVLGEEIRHSILSLTFADFADDEAAEAA